MNRPRLILMLLLVWPLLGAAGLIGVKEFQLSRAEILPRIPITGYDPRNLLHGHYIRFRFDGPHAPDARPHDYYIPELHAGRLEDLLRGREHRMAIDVRRTAAGDMSFGGLYIDDIEWRDYMKQNPDDPAYR